MTSCPARRCSGIRAPINFVASLLLALLNFVASFLCSAHVLNFFVASLWSAQLPRLPIDRSTHRKPHWETLFSVELLLAWKKKGHFRMVRHKRSAPAYFLSWRQPSVSPVHIFLLAMRRRASSPCSLWHSVFQPLSVTGGFALLVALRPNFFHCNFIKKLCERSGLWARKKGKDFFLAWASCQLQRTCSSYLQRMPVHWQTIDTRRLLDFETFLPDRSSKYRQTDPRKSAKKLSDFWKSLHVQSRVVAQWDFWEAVFGFLCGATWWLLQETVWTIGIVSTEEKARIFSSLSELPALAEKDIFVVLTAYSMWVPWETIDTWLVGFRNLFYPTDPRNTDRLTKESLRKNSPIIGKAFKG